MALRGTLGDFSLTDILQLISLQRKSGLLVLRRTGEEISIGFEQGKVVLADSTSRPGEQKLGRLLVRTGKLTEERLEDALRRQRATLQRLGNVLVDLKWVDRETVRRQLTLQIQETIFDLFRWRDGEYDFQPDARVNWDRDFVQPLPAENLLMEGARMVDEWPLIERVIPSAGVVLRLTDKGSQLLATAPDVQEARGSVYDEDIDFGFIPSDPLEEKGKAKKRLLEQERAVLRWVNGRHSVGEIAELSGLGTFDTFHTLAQLIEEKLLERAPVSTGAEEHQAPQVLRNPTPAHAIMVLVTALAAFSGLVAVQESLRLAFPLPSILPALGFSSSEALASVSGVDRVRRATSGARLDRIEAALSVYFLDEGNWPTRLSDLVERKLLPEVLTRDPWGEPYAYQTVPGGYRLAENGLGDRAPLVREHRVAGGGS